MLNTLSWYIKIIYIYISWCCVVLNCTWILSPSLCPSCDLQYEYFNAVLINEVDELGNSVELGGEFILQPNDHFNNLSVNLSLSVVQVPTNMYNKGAFASSKQEI